MEQYFPAVKRMKNGYFIGYFTFTPNFIRITFPFEGGQTLLTEAQLVVYNILKRGNMASRNLLRIISALILLAYKAYVFTEKKWLHTKGWYF